MNVGRERDVADAIQSGVEVIYRVELEQAVAELAARDDFGFEFRTLRCQEEGPLRARKVYPLSVPLCDFVFPCDANGVVFEESWQPDKAGRREFEARTCQILQAIETRAARTIHRSKSYRLLMVNKIVY